MNKAIFLDRDGTINEEMGYINHISRFKIFPFVPSAIRIFNQLNYKVIIITNQAGLARGYFDENHLLSLHRYLLQSCKSQNAIIDKIYYCPHLPDADIPVYKKNCTCRKPKPGMLIKAHNEFDISFSESFMIGDRYKDVKFGKDQGIKSIFLLTGYGLGEFTDQRKTWTEKPDHICKDLFAAAQLVKKLYS